VPVELRGYDPGARGTRPRAVGVPRREIGTRTRMGILDRLSTLLRSNINDLISSAEHPEKMLNQVIVEMRAQLVRAKQQVAAAIADEKRLRDQADAEVRQAQD